MYLRVLNVISPSFSMEKSAFENTHNANLNFIAIKIAKLLILFKLMYKSLCAVSIVFLELDHFFLFGFSLSVWCFECNKFTDILFAVLKSFIYSNIHNKNYKLAKCSKPNIQFSRAIKMIFCMSFFQRWIANFFEQNAIDILLHSFPHKHSIGYKIFTETHYEEIDCLI